jgi:putative MFS transporter
MTFVVTMGLGVAIGLFAGLLVIAALAALAIDAETRQTSLT